MPKPRALSQWQVFQIRRLSRDLPETFTKWRKARECKRELSELLMNVHISTIYDVVCNHTFVEPGGIQ